MNKITACLVVRNEEKLIGRCLESIKDVVDEVIVVHDGECSDGTLDIAKAFTKEIYVRPQAGACEFHLPFCFEKATGDWILRIDADEYLSEGLRNKLREPLDKDIAAYEFVWPLWDGTREVTRDWPHKLCLIKKSELHFVSVVHFLPTIEGRIERSGLVLHHRPGYNNYSWASFKNKWRKWASLQAAGCFSDPKDLPSFNFDAMEWPARVQLRKKHPLAVMPLDFIKGFISIAASANWRDGLIVWKYACLAGLYKSAVDWEIYKIKKGKREDAVNNHR